MRPGREALLEALARPDPLGYRLLAPRPPGAMGAPGVDWGAALEAARGLGFDAAMLREASLVLVDESVAAEAARRRAERMGAYVLPLAEALREIPEVRRAAWSLLNPTGDPYAAAAALLEEEGHGEGYAVYVPRGVRLGFPIYACMLVTRGRSRQILHNIVVLEEGAEATIVTGCAAAPRAVDALHASTTEIHLGPGARLAYAMIHSWAPTTHVRPRAAARLAAGASMVSYYVLHGGLASLHSASRTVLGPGARLHEASIMVLERGEAHASTTVELVGSGSSAELVSRVIAKGEARVRTPLRITAAARARGHIECTGLTLSPRASIASEPALESRVTDAELTHEAAIGRLREEEIEYLIARGLDEATARRLLIQGLLRVEVPGIPPAIRALMRSVEKLLAERGAA